MNIEPAEKISGIAEIPGDKSITHRAVMFNAAAEGKAKITRALVGEDCLSTVSCMKALGAKIEPGRAKPLPSKARPNLKITRCAIAATAARLCASYAA